MYDRSKRLLDIVLASTILVMAAPILLMIGAAIKLTSGSPVLYSGRRMGLGAQCFKMYKFRTMRVGADQGPGITRDSDPRVTTIGRLLRKWKLDEIPQLINVVAGAMSMVGPRPESPIYLGEYTQEQLEVLSVKPGITGPTQLVYLHEERILEQGDFEDYYRKVLLPAKLAMDLEYVRSRSLLRDVKLILATAFRVVGREWPGAGHGDLLDEPR